MSQPLGHVNDRSRGDAGEEAFSLQQQPHRLGRLGVRDEKLAVELGHVEDRRHIAVLERAEPHHGISRQRLRSRHDDVGEGLAQPLSGAHQRASGAQARDEAVDAVERLGDLGARALVVGAWIGFVRVLERHEIARLALGQLERHAD